MVEKVIIMGAAGRDFHNFNVYYRDNERYQVVCFTATQIPDIDDRLYPPQLSGAFYPKGIPVKSDERLMDLVRDLQVDLVAFSYSDVSHTEVMHKASQVTAAGADFIIIDRNLLTCLPDDIQHTKVLATYLDGEKLDIPELTDP